MRLYEIDRFDPEQELKERLQSEYSRISTETFIKWKTITNNFNSNIEISTEFKNELLRSKMSIMTSKLKFRRIIGSDSNAVKKMDIILDYLNKIV